MEFINDPVTQTLVKTVQNEQPKIEASVKNLIAFLMGRSITCSSDSSLISPSNLMTLAKTLIQTINLSTITEPTEYFSCKPQGDGSGIDRLDFILRYKTIYYLREKVINSGGKVHKLFGVSYFLWSDCWAKIRNDTTKALITKYTGGIEDIKLFLDTYEESLQPSGLKNNSNCSHDLIWASDFNQALKNRQEKRVKEVSERNEKMAQELKEMISSPQVEELNENETAENISNSNELNSNIIIREFQEKDQKSAHEVALEGYTAYKGINEELTKAQAWYASTVTDINDIQSHYINDPDDRKTFFVAVDQNKDKIVGCVAVVPISKFDENLLEFKRLSVTESYRGKGIGKLLVKKVEDFALKMGFEGVYLSTWREQTVAFSFYPKIGYTLREIEDLDVSFVFDFPPKTTFYHISHFTKSLG